jgi:LPS export ABC transporter protein LptC
MPKTANYKPNTGLSLAVLLLLAALAGCGSSSAPPPPPPERSQTQGTMESFDLTEIQEGNKHWNLQAQKAQFLKDRLLVQINGIKVEFFGPASGATPIRLTCQEGQVHTKTRVLTLRGQVDMEIGDVRLKTSSITYQPEERALIAPEDVTIQAPRFTITGKGLRLDLVQRKLVLSQHAQTNVAFSGKGLPL